ncbi:hypothetical protein A3Q56_05184, partial [Intoshia linei]
MRYEMPREEIDAILSRYNKLDGNLHLMCLKSNFDKLGITLSGFKERCDSNILPPSSCSVYITHIDKNSIAHKHLKIGDLILQVNDYILHNKSHVNGVEIIRTEMKRKHLIFIVFRDSSLQSELSNDNIRYQ